MQCHSGSWIPYDSFSGLDYMTCFHRIYTRQDADAADADAADSAAGTLPSSCPTSDICSKTLHQLLKLWSHLPNKSDKIEF